MTTRDLRFSADFQFAQSEGDALPRNFSGIAYSGGLVPGYNLVIDLATVRTDKSMPLMAQHRHEAIIGAINQVGNDGSQLTVAGEIFSDFDTTAMDVARKASRGIPYQMSVGVFHANEEFVAAGKTVAVNGRTFAGPVSVLRDAYVRETSIVALGADPATRATLFSHQGATEMTIEQLMAKVAELEAKLSAMEADKTALAAERDTLKTELAALKTAAETAAKEARLSAVKQLFADTKREFSEAATAPYLALAQDAFDAVAKDMRGIRSLNPALFADQATGGAPAGGTATPGGTSVVLSSADIFEARRKAATGTK